MQLYSDGTPFALARRLNIYEVKYALVWLILDEDFEPQGYADGTVQTCMFTHTDWFGKKEYMPDWHWLDEELSNVGWLTIFSPNYRDGYRWEEWAAEEGVEVNQPFLVCVDAPVTTTHNTQDGTEYDQEWSYDILFIERTHSVPWFEDKGEKHAETANVSPVHWRVADA